MNSFSLRYWKLSMAHTLLLNLDFETDFSFPPALSVWGSRELKCKTMSCYTDFWSVRGQEKSSCNTTRRDTPISSTCRVIKNTGVRGDFLQDSKIELLGDDATYNLKLVASSGKSHRETHVCIRTKRSRRATNSVAASLLIAQKIER